MVGSLATALGIGPGREIAREELGEAGWFHIGLHSRGRWGRTRLHIALEASGEFTLAQLGLEGLFLHPFSLELSMQGEPVGEWSDTLSRYWAPQLRTKEGGPTLRYRFGGRFPLLDLELPARTDFELHFRCPRSDREKRDGFEATSRLEHAVVRVYSQSALRRLVAEPGYDSAVLR